MVSASKNIVLLGIGFIALNEAITSTKSGNSEILPNCRNLSLLQNTKRIVSTIEKVTLQPNRASKIDCSILNNYLTRFKYYYHRFFHTHLNRSKNLNKNLNQLALKTLFLLL